jgi:hypothetical protein
MFVGEGIPQPRGDSGGLEISKLENEGDSEEWHGSSGKTRVERRERHRG